MWVAFLLSATLYSLDSCLWSRPITLLAVFTIRANLALFLRVMLPYQVTILTDTPQWGAADAEIKVPSVEKTELERFPFKAWSRSVYSHTCYAYYQRFLSCLFLHFRSIQLHFFQTSPDFSLCWLWLTHGSCVGPQNKIGHPAGCRFPCWVPAEYK